MGILKTLLVSIAAMAVSLSAIAQSSTTTSSAASNTTTLRKVAEKPSPLDFTYFSETYLGVAEANRGSADGLDNYHYLRARYRTSSSESIELRQYFHTTVGPEGQSDSAIGNTVGQYVNTKQARFQNRDVVSAVRVYLPTGRDAQDNLTSQLRGYLIWNTPLAIKNLTFEAILSPRLYGSFRDQTDQTGAAMVTSADFSYKINNTFSVNFNPYLYDVWSRSGIAADESFRPSNSDSLFLLTGLTANITEKLWVQTVIEHERDLRARGENLYDEDSTVYGLVVSATM